MAIVIMFALSVCVLPIPVEVVMTVDAVAEDPMDVAIAPHYSRVVYALEEPVYATGCDARGDFKASVGTPTISLDDSRLVISATAATHSTVVLATSDVPALNQSRAYYEMCLSVSNTLAYVNISLYDTGANDWVNMSIQSGAWYYDYDSGIQQKGVLYSPAAAGTDFVVAFELAEASVTLFLYSSTGTLLADKYIATNRLVGGDLDEIRFELAGSYSSSLAIDYLYVLGQKPASTFLGTSARPGSIVPDGTLEGDRVDIDPTSLSFDKSLRSELFGFENPLVNRRMTELELITAMGSTPIHQQRAAGRLIAEGYNDLRYSIEDSLIDYIADAENVEYDDVYLVDYYIDYTELKIEIDSGVTEKIVGEFNAIAEPIVETFGGYLLEDATTASSMYTDMSISSSNDSWLTYAFFLPVIIADGIRGLLDDPLGLDDAADAAKKALDDAADAAAAAADQSRRDIIALYNSWLNSSDEKFDAVEGILLNYMSVSQAQFSEMLSSYDEVMDKFERTMSQYYAYTQQQFEATNAIIGQLLLQNMDLSQTQAELTKYFAGEMAKTNEVIMNLTSALASNLDPSSIWASVLNDGKASSEPLTFSGVFGSNLQEVIVVVIVVALVVMMTIALAVMLRRKKRGGSTKSRT